MKRDLIWSSTKSFDDAAKFLANRSKRQVDWKSFWAAKGRFVHTPGSRSILESQFERSQKPTVSRTTPERNFGQLTLSGLWRRPIRQVRRNVRGETFTTQYLQGDPEMRFIDIAYDLELALVADEALVVLAKECLFCPAEEELLLRYRSWCSRLISRLGRRRGLTSHEIEDAAQDSVFSILKAIERYDTDQMGRIRGCSFQSFIGRVATDRFKDFVKKLYRTKIRFGCSLDTFHRTDCPGEAPHDSGRFLVCPKKTNDPVHMSQRREMDAQLGDFLNDLDDSAKMFMELLLGGTSLREAAERAGFSYDQGKRMRRRLRGQLARRLGVLRN